MSNYNDKSNNEIIIEIKRLEVDHETTKNSILILLDRLDKIEKKAAEAKNIILKRLK